MIIGIAGKIASGKDAVAEVFSKKGWEVIDLDKIGHKVLEEKKDALIGEFTNGILDRKGMIDRKKLSRMVFNNRKAFKKLESIVHPVMVDKVKAIVSAGDNNYVLNAAILFEMGLHVLCDTVIWVHAPLLKRIKWLKKRNKLKNMQILKILLKQKKLSSKPWQNAVDIYYIGNKYSLESLRKETAGFIMKLANREG